MKLLSINISLKKKWASSLALTLAGLLTLPAYAWPEVDHMNMCGAPTKTVQSYSGSWKGWAQYDRAVKKRGNTYYLNTNCPNIVAPTKKAVSAKKTIYKKQKVSKKSSRTIVKRRAKRSKYNEKLDCARVDKMNGFEAK